MLMVDYIGIALMWLGLVAPYHIRPGNGDGLFWFWRVINMSLTYLRRHLSTYLQPWDPHEARSDDNTLPSVL